MNFNSFLARRFVGMRRKSLRSFGVLVSVAGIFMASVFVLVSLGVLAGFQRSYENAILNFNAHIMIFRNGLNLDDQKQIRAVLDTHTGVAYSRYRFRDSLVPTRAGLRPVVIKAIDWSQIGAVYPLQIQSWPTELKSKIAVGKNLADLVPESKTQGRLRILSLSSKTQKTRLEYQTIPLSGAFSSGLYDFDSQFVLMDLEDFKRYTAGDETVEGFEVHLHDLNQLDVIVQDLQRELPGFEIMTWKQLNRPLLQTMVQEKRSVFAIAILVLAIACLNIFGFSFLFFLERRGEFLILAALGMGLWRLRRLMVRLSLVLGGGACVCATFVSLLVLKFMSSGRGIPLDAEVYFVDHVPVEIRPIWFVGFVITALLFCLATSWLAGRVILRRELTSELAR